MQVRDTLHSTIEVVCDTVPLMYFLYTRFQIRKFLSIVRAISPLKFGSLWISYLSICVREKYPLSYVEVCIKLGLFYT